MKVKSLLVCLAAVTLASVGACAGDTTDEAAPGPAVSNPVPDLAGADEALLSRTDLPRLSGQLTTLTAEDVADEATDAEVLADLQEAGFVGGVRRDLRGRSRDIAGADSRVLVFSDGAGAASFLDVVAADPDAFFGAPSEVRPLTLGGAEGVLIKPPICACAGAQPIYVGLVAAGDRLLWLQITGANASAADVRELLSGAVDASR